MIFAVMAQTGGIFEYPLDDTYIHLAIADVISKGGYGANLGEYSSPGSSPLYPFLLTPFAGSDVQRFVPLIWNVAALGGLSWLWGLVLTEAGYLRAGWRPLGVLVAVLGPTLMMMPTVAMTGMEHSLQALAALAVVAGLLRYARGTGGIGLILFGAFFGAAFRFEGAALGLAAGLALFFTGARRQGLGAIGLTLLPLLAFMAFLNALGLDALPSSVKVKLARGGSDTSLSGGLLSPGHLVELMSLPVLLLVFLALLIVVLWWTTPALRSRRWSWGIGAVLFAIVAHLAVGRFGWMFRYEHYVLVAGAAMAFALAPMADVTPRRRLSVLAVLACAALVYLPQGLAVPPQAAVSIFNQQRQMARLAKDELRMPVAVNDLGWVAWRNPNEVLDLWGLASAEARVARIGDGSPGWAGRLTAEHNVPVAMIYDHWFGAGIGAEWQKVATLTRPQGPGVLGVPIVSFYATSAAAVDPLRDALQRWLPGLPPADRFAWAEGMAP